MKKGWLNFLHGVWIFAIVFGATAYWFQVFEWILSSL